MAFTVVALGFLFAFSASVLRVAQPPGHCDAIVLLGGATGERDPIAAKLFHAGCASRIIVTGQGDCLDNMRALARRGVRTDAIIVECQSRSTKENAQAVVRIARQHHFTNAIIVTSWFHSRRSLATFRKLAPNLNVRCAVSDQCPPSATNAECSPRSTSKSFTTPCVGVSRRGRPETLKS